MKLCPYCSKTLTDHALACKYCGEWLEDISDYLKKKGSIYADTDSMVIPHDINSNVNLSHPQKINSKCVFCEFPVNLSENELKEKSFVCPECGKKNIVTGKQIDDILRNIPIGWGWVLLTVYFTVAMQKYLTTLDDVLQIAITFTASLILLLYIYFFVRRFIIKERYRKKNSFGKIYDASLMSGTVSTVGVVLFVFFLHIIYPYSGLQSDKKETNLKVKYYRSKIYSITDRQKEISDIISKPVSGKKEALANLNLLDTYIKLNNEEKSYADSIYQSLSESDYYTDKNDSKKKIKEANLLISKIIAYKNMSAQNLKSYYLSGNENAFKSVQELNFEIAKLNKEFSSKYLDLFLED